MEAELIFVLGKGGVGKSTYSRSQNADIVISLDEIIRHWLDPESSNENYAFNVYRLGGNQFIQGLKKKLVNLVREQLYGKCIIEGAIEDPELIKLIADGYKYRIVYLVPANRDVLKKSMIKRVNYEYKTGIKYLMKVWHNLSQEELADYEQNGDTGILFQMFIDHITDERYATISSTLELLTDMEYSVVKIDW